jgi:hypothetical protein
VNDFINPRNRSVNLPKGYKDLMDVLTAKKRSGTAEIYFPVKTERIPSGGLAQVEKYLQRFLMFPEVRCDYFLNVLTADGSGLSLFKSKKEAHAFFFTSLALEKLICESIGKLGINPISTERAVGNNLIFVEVVLPTGLPDLLRIITTLLIDAYGISPASALTFIYRD